MEELTEGQIKRLKNLRLYKDKSNEEIVEMIKQKRESQPIRPTGNRSYDTRFREKFETLKTDFGVDMNDSNDKESLSALVRHLLQAEDIDKDIRELMGRDMSREDVLVLKNLGEVQRNIHMSIEGLQDKLGISRKTRKEKQVDDIPQFIDSILKKAKSAFDRKTITVDCPKCQIELVRYWLNFPQLTTLASFTTECFQCGEKVEYTR